jgi:hypothetical protein
VISIPGWFWEARGTLVFEEGERGGDGFGSLARFSFARLRGRSLSKGRRDPPRPMPVAIGQRDGARRSEEEGALHYGIVRTVPTVMRSGRLIFALLAS